MDEFEAWDPPEERTVESIRERIAATRSDGDLEPAEPPWLWVTTNPNGSASLVYGDGDGCATVHGNIVLGNDAVALAKLFACAADDIEYLLGLLDSG